MYWIWMNICAVLTVMENSFVTVIKKAGDKVRL